jgi:hypothetical protein
LSLEPSGDSVLSSGILPTGWNNHSGWFIDVISMFYRSFPFFWSMSCVFRESIISVKNKAAKPISQNFNLLFVLVAAKN